METKLRLWIIHKLYTRGYIGRRLMNADDLKQGISPHYAKLILKIADKLTKEGILLRKISKGGGWRYSINAHKLKDVIKMNEEWKKISKFK